jgi:hypothetical protein
MKRRSFKQQLYTVPGKSKKVLGLLMLLPEEGDDQMESTACFQNPPEFGDYPPRIARMLQYHHAEDAIYRLRSQGKILQIPQDIQV